MRSSSATYKRIEDAKDDISMMQEDDIGMTR